MNADGSGRTNITNTPNANENEPSWSSDGTKIAVEYHGRETIGADIVVMDADGSGWTNITDSPTYEGSPSWSPDGTKIVFDTSRDSNSEVYVMNADGSGQTNLSNNSEFDGQASWQPVNPPPPDNATPETTIASGPRGPTNDSTPTFTFSGSDDVTASADLLYSYKVDEGDWSAYASATSVTLGGELGLGDGPHAFYVRAKDKLANEDVTPAEQSFTVDTVRPETVIDSGPSGLTNSRSASFVFSSEPGAPFECKLDSEAGFGPCASPKEYAELPDGEHVFQVRATDAALNADSTPAEARWTVDTNGPNGSVVIKGGRRFTSSRTAKLALEATDPEAGSGVVSMRLKNAGGSWTAWRPYAESKDWKLTRGAGKKTVYAQYRDAAGNVSAKASDSITYRP